MQYVGGSTALLNQRISIHRRRKSRCEISIYHYRNVCNNAMFEYWLQREDDCTKTICTLHSDGLIERTKFIQQLPRCISPFINTKTPSEKNNHDLYQFPLKHCSIKCRKLLEIFKKRELKLFRRQDIKMTWSYNRTCFEKSI